MYLAPKGTLLAVGLPPKAKLEADIGYLVWKVAYQRFTP